MNSATLDLPPPALITPRLLTRTASTWKWRHQWDNAPHPRFEDGTVHESIPVEQFQRAHTNLPIKTRDYTFLDLGCGNGRALCLARYAGYSSIMGVELIPHLAKAAREATKGFDNVSIFNGDAAVVSSYPDKTLVYLFNPFGYATLAAVLKNIEASKVTDLYILYVVPVHKRVFGARWEIVHDASNGWAGSRLYRLVTENRMIKSVAIKRLAGSP